MADNLLGFALQQAFHVDHKSSCNDEVLKGKLKYLGLNTAGSKDALRERLRKHLNGLELHFLRGLTASDHYKSVSKKDLIEYLVTNKYNFQSRQTAHKKQPTPGDLMGAFVANAFKF